MWFDHGEKVLLLLTALQFINNCQKFQLEFNGRKLGTMTGGTMTAVKAAELTQLTGCFTQKLEI